jgi:acetyl-CoA carboxylase carboxyl transferase subunit alpha
MLDFERKIAELNQKMEELICFSNDQDMDLSQEIQTLQEQLIKLQKSIYANLSPWDKVMLSRKAQRPTALEYIEIIFDSFIELHGDRNFADDPSIVGGIASLNGMPVTVIGQQKGQNTKDNIQRNFGMPHPEGYRKALRLMKQAEKFHRPVICFIDTPGAFCGIGAEERGQGEAIATNLLEMSKLKTPIVSIVIGEGGSGGALALGVADNIAMLENAIYSILSPEGFASILWKDSSRAKEAAEIMKITAQDLKVYTIIDEIIPEPLGGAHIDKEQCIENIKQYLLEELSILQQEPVKDLLEKRYHKYRGIGEYEIGHYSM